MTQGGGIGVEDGAHRHVVPRPLHPPAEVEVVEHRRRVEQAVEGGIGVVHVAGLRQRLAADGTAGHRVALEHGDAPSGSRQQRRGHQPVRARADDDCVDVVARGPVGPHRSITMPSAAACTSTSRALVGAHDLVDGVVGPRGVVVEEEQSTGSRPLGQPDRVVDRRVAERRPLRQLGGGVLRVVQEQVDPVGQRERRRGGTRPARRARARARWGCGRTGRRSWRRPSDTR